MEMRLLAKMMLHRFLGLLRIALHFGRTEKSIPQIQYAPKIIQFWGITPYSFETKTLCGRIKNYRHVHGLSHKKLGKMLGVDATTVGAWEANESPPERPNLERLNELLGK